MIYGQVSAEVNTCLSQSGVHYCSTFQSRVDGICKVYKNSSHYRILFKNFQIPWLLLLLLL